MLGFMLGFMLFSFDLWFSTWIYVFSTWIYVFSVLIYDFLPWFMFFNLDLCFSVLIYDFQPWFMFCWGKGGLTTIKNWTFSWFFWFLSPPLVASCRCGGGRGLGVPRPAGKSLGGGQLWRWLAEKYFLFFLRGKNL